MEIRILSDIERISDVPQANVHVSVVKFPKQMSSIHKVLKIISMSRDYDYILLNFSRYIFLLGLFKLLLPVIRCKVAILDLFVPHPGNQISVLDHLKKYVMILGLKKVDTIFLYSKDNVALSKAYSIDPDKLKYIPFKINSYEYVTKQKVDDMGYIFSGGQSRRDFKTLIEACREVPYPVKIVTPDKEQAKVHGTLVDKCLVPSNVEIVHDDGSIESFVSLIAHSKFVVIPTKINDFASTGTSVYLISMALKKCVVISSGPTTKGILDDNIAVVVPPEDPLSLRRAIEKVYNDTKYRDAIAHNGHKYALSLGGLNTFYQSLLNEVMNNLQQREPSIGESAEKN